MATKTRLPDSSCETTKLTAQQYSDCWVDKLLPLTLPSGESQRALNARASRHLCPIPADSTVPQPGAV